MIWLVLNYIVWKQIFFLLLLNVKQETKLLFTYHFITCSSCCAYLRSPIGGRRRSTDSLPYGKGSPPSSRRPSFDPNSAPATVPEQVESPTDSTIAQKTPVDIALSSVSAGGSSCSPPPGTVCLLSFFFFCSFFILYL